MIKRTYKYICIIALLASVSFVGCTATQRSYYVDDNYNAAKNHFENARYTQAIESYKAFMAENPESPLNEIVLYYIGKSHQELGQQQQAIDSYQILISRFEPDFWVNLAQEEIKLIQSQM